MSTNYNTGELMTAKFIPRGFFSADVTNIQKHYLPPFITYCLLALHPDTKEFHRTGPQVPSAGVRQIPSDRVQDSSQQHTILIKRRGVVKAYT